MKTSIIIPNFNGLSLLQKNLKLIISACPDSEIIMVDDASTDGSINYLKSKRANIRLLANAKNLGFAETVNKGVNEAKGEIVVLLNTDVVPEKGFLQPLLAHFGNEKVFAVACMEESRENGQVVLRGRGVGRFMRGFLVHARGEVDRNDTLWVSGGSGAFRRDKWIELGGLDTLYNPFYYEDIDLSYRAVKAGLSILFEAKSRVKHEHGEGAIQKNYHNFFIKTVAFRNQMIFVWKNITDGELLMEHLLYLPYHLIVSVLKLDFPFIIGFVWALIKLPRVLVGRAKVRRLFRLRDKDILR